MKLILLILIALMVSCKHSEQEFKLEDLILSKTELPENCELKPIEKDTQLPCEATTNPFISSNRSFIACFSGGFISDKSLIKSINRALFSVYISEDEIGIFALEAESKLMATLLAENLKRQNISNSQLFQQDQIIIIVWCDQENNDAFKKIKSLIADRISSK